MLGDARLSLWLIYALFADILVGSMIMQRYPELFYPLQDRFLQQWLLSYGAGNPRLTWWFFVALLLLSALALTTAVCGTDRAVAVVARFSRDDIRGSFLRLAPTVVHVGFLLLLAGQLVSHTLGVNSHGNILAVGGAVRAPGSGIKVVLRDLKVDFFGRDTRFLGMAGKVRDCTGTLAIVDRSGIHRRRISINRPVRYRGWSFFIADFYPKTRGAKKPPFINLIIRKDPGTGLLAAGAIVFGLGLVMYLLLAARTRSGCAPAGMSMNSNNNF
ncbi:MAG: hypothetical protein GXP57_09140 [Deltaproteobacteria bacterium]|nr:hypothetical protein [Deltaproteobacteria bacterium]